ncbi:MAG TPA: lysophospholipid acyltransferase family protein [Ktedonobacterales bacterium]
MTSANVPMSPPTHSDERVGYASKGFYTFARAVVIAIHPLIARLRTVGIENVPQTGPVVLAVNHVAWIDIPLASIRVPRITHYMAKIELFRLPVLGGIMRLLGAFPVRRGERDREALRISERLLKQGEVLVIFPEGHRSGGHLIEAHPGTSLIALRTGAPVVPVAISGTEHVFKGFRYGPWAPHVTISYGKPFHLEAASGGHRTREDLARSTDLIMYRIAELLPPEYRGIYALPPAGETAAPTSE